ncbi:MAG: hypothetical protein EXQ56_13475 [Acidobacteria bacterium]|nr:hypothetical protein [Acidobacteriota bacterium]
MTLYAVTIFLSAFLLFQVQPLIAKIILPWFGGSAAVWSASMLFFQLLLLGGYAYAHLSIRFLKSRAQMQLHLALLAVSCLLLPILPSPSWRPTEAGDPTLRILLLLAATIGLPYFLLSSTSPLLQAWFVRRTGSSVPYRLFALSNFGSMLALVSYPFLVEPRLGTRPQAYTWTGVYVVFAAVCAFTAWVSRESVETSFATEVNTNGEATERPTAWQLIFWVVLAACASVLLVSITNHMSENVAPIPLLWILPLTLYLLTFIFAFESDRIYQRWLFIPLLVPALGGMAYMLYANEGNYNIKNAIPGFAAAMFVSCMFCHGELARRRPAPQYLTLFYLMVSLGGALGGIFVALIAPRAFSAYWELPLALVVCGLLAMIAVWKVTMPKLVAWPIRAAILVATGVLAGYLIKQERAATKNLVLQTRNFYGPLEVRDDLATQDYAERTLLHGTINHGSQLTDAVLRYVTTSYYGKRSGVGRALTALQAKGPIRAGFVGLGSGVLTNYGRTGDYIRVYEINPLIERIAQTLFTFYPHSPADKAILMGDARLTLENQLKEGPQNYDLLAVDAFSSDAIPVHLLTREAIQLYFRHLKPEGVLALHISNRYLDLKPVCEGGAQAVGRSAWAVEDEGDQASYFSSSTWVLITSDKSFYETEAFKDAYSYELAPKKGFRSWTDDYSNLFQILNVK